MNADKLTQIIKSCCFQLSAFRNASKAGLLSLFLTCPLAETVALKPKLRLTPFGDVIKGLCQISDTSQTIVVLWEAPDTLWVSHVIHTVQHLVPFIDFDLALCHFAPMNSGVNNSTLLMLVVVHALWNCLSE